jgi:hypothetical protein
MVRSSLVGPFVVAEGFLRKAYLGIGRISGAEERGGRNYCSDSLGRKGPYCSGHKVRRFK